ncbi:hypothetical protein [Actinocrinis sp.]|uniref:hypothetical protein n=1 Tax=Actinocrinis sp. TaxID=1920516 RepID=UPI002C7AA4C6|nr:hypothetical protein [Actinocrinis sp.]HXR73380.1 hypothetical protein [Actinocrinis sp.]
MEQRVSQTGQSEIFILKRLGSTPAQRGSTNDMNCPDIFLLSDGRLACIGTDVTDKLRDHLPSGASIGDDERLVSLPRQVLLDAIPEILKS